MTIECKYSCDLCGLHRVSVHIPVRQRTQAVTFWMDHTVTPALIQDHEKRSPGCRPSTLTELMIPMPPGTDMIGAPVQN